ncbi:hypothetical protein VN12_23150 [Pirellula sp. SH-Sr6A]|nr:hypothetical protein VN12_23150 [Pirellula sp. SH-Sr6A]
MRPLRLTMACPIQKTFIDNPVARQFVILVIHPLVERAPQGLSVAPQPVMVV